MKPLEISEEQKEKLLEMCKVLFPELKHLEIRNSMEDFCLPFEHICVEFGRNDNNTLTIIHWFEFCMLKIFPKLNQWFNAHQLSDFFYQTIGNDKKCEPNVLNKFEHPIEYLYEQFKIQNHAKTTNN